MDLISIDALSGAVKWGTIVIHRSITKKELLQAAKDEIRCGREHTVGAVLYTHCFLPPVQVNNTSAHCTVYFENSRITFLDFNLGMPSDSLGWEGVSESTELERQALHEAFLETQLGAPHEREPHPGTPFRAAKYQFGWGSVVSCLDVKNGTVGILVRYSGMTI